MKVVVERDRSTYKLPRIDEVTGTQYWQDRKFPKLYPTHSVTTESVERMVQLCHQLSIERAVSAGYLCGVAQFVQLT